MSEQILTEVSAVVAESRAADVVPAFQALAEQGLPDGLLRTELISGGEGEWRIQSLWRDGAALDAMRASGPPAAPELFRRLGAEPSVRIWKMAHRQE